jgi:hypothetical protein
LIAAVAILAAFATLGAVLNAFAPAVSAALVPTPTPGINKLASPNQLRPAAPIVFQLGFCIASLVANADPTIGINDAPASAIPPKSCFLTYRSV